MNFVIKRLPALLRGVFVCNISLAQGSACMHKGGA